MSGFTTYDKPIPRDELAERLFSGTLIVFRALAPVVHLVELTQRRIEAAYGAAVQDIDRKRAFEELCRSAESLRQEFAAATDIREAYAELFSTLGFTRQDTFGDRRVLRMVPPGPRREEPALRSLPPHRDTWGSNVSSQINWWAPVCTLHEANTLLLYPSYWARPIANTTRSWNLEALYAARQRGEAYPRLPVAEEEPDSAAALPCIIAPGDLLCFSGAQLHASALNRSGRTRFSIETRTVSLCDLQAGRCAPAIDGSPGVPAYHWFARLADDASLQSVIGESERP